LPEHDELQELIMDDGITLDSWQAGWLTALISSTQDSPSHPELNLDLAKEHPDSSSSSSSSKLYDAVSSIVQVPDLLPPRAAANSSADEAAAAAAVAAAASAASSPSSNNTKRFAFRDLGISEEQLWGAIGEEQQLLSSSWSTRGGFLL
jgi:hypothetical protein